VLHQFATVACVLPILNPAVFVTFDPVARRELPAQQPSLTPSDPVVERSALAAIQWLVSKQVPSGNWSYEGFGASAYGASTGKYDVGVTGLVGVALLEAGLPPGHVAIQKAAAYLRSELSRKSQYALLTYNASTAALFLDKLGDPRDVTLLRGLFSAIRDGQLADGGWGYYVTAGHAMDQDAVRGGSDNSNTQFAAIALLAGHNRIEGIGDALERAAARFLPAPATDAVIRTAGITKGTSLPTFR
jgi:hypothetical protein